MPSAATTNPIFNWKTGFFSDRAGSPMIMTMPVASSTSNPHQITGRKREQTRSIG